MFAIKKCKSNGQIVGHLPREISKVTKFLLDRGAVVQATLSTTHYKRLPLVQGGLEIACKVSVKMRETIKNHLLMDRYFELVISLYTESKNEVILGSFLRPLDVPCTPKSNARKIKEMLLYLQKKTKPNRDLRTMFQYMKRKNNETNREHNFNRPLILIIIINIFEYLALSTTLHPLTSIIPYKKRLSSLQYSVFYKSYFMINFI